MKRVLDWAVRALPRALALTWFWAGLTGPGIVQAQQADLATLLESFGLRLKVVQGQRVVEVSLKQVLQLALERNLALQSVRVGEAVSESALRAAQDRFSPKLTNKFEYGRSLARSSVSNGTALYAGSDGATLSATFTKPTASGMEYSLTYAERNASGIAASPGTVAETERVGTRAVTGAVKIPIGQDAGSAYNTIAVRRSEAGLEISRATSRESELNLLEVAALTFWDLVAAQANVHVQEEAVKLSEQLLVDNRQRLQAGVLSPFDVQVTETQLARDRERLVAAQADVLRIEDQARALLNLSVIDFQVEPLDRPHVRALPGDYPALQRRVFDSNTSLKQLQARIANKELDLAEARNDERTNLDLELFYTLQQAPSYGASELNGYGASLTWTVPLFDVQTEETLRQRTLERQQLQLQVDSQRSDLDVRLQGLLRQIRVATEQVDTSRRARELAEEQLKNEIERFRVGETTSFQVSQSQQAASEARVQEILAQLSFERNYLQLLILTGDIYQQYGLEPSQR